MARGPNRRTSAAVVKSSFVSFGWLVARATSPKHSKRNESCRVTTFSPAAGAVVTDDAHAVRLGEGEVGQHELARWRRRCTW